MTREEEIKYLDYASQFRPPAEVEFFTSEQILEWQKMRKKFDTSQQIVASIIDKDNFEELLEKAILENRVFSASTMSAIQEKINAIDYSEGVRISLYETLVSKSGQRVIMSDRLASILGFYGDGPILKDKAEKLVSALEADGVATPLVDKVNSMIHKYGAIILQEGIYLVLKDWLEDALERSLATYNANAGNSIPSPQPPPNMTPGPELPFSFIEYLKNTDKDYDRVENEVMKDPQFLQFFEALKKQYDFYKTMPLDRMAGELIVRPQIWNKLSPQNQAPVMSIVEKHRQEFMSKIRQVAATSHAEKLEELKKSLGK
jgi:hypothetical protein